MRFQDIALLPFRSSFCTTLPNNEKEKMTLQRILEVSGWLVTKNYLASTNYVLQQLDPTNRLFQ